MHFGPCDENGAGHYVSSIIDCLDLADSLSFANGELERIPVQEGFEGGLFGRVERRRYVPCKDALERLASAIYAS